MKKKLVYEESSEKVFADLGIENPEEALAKSELARQLQSLLRRKSSPKNEPLKI